MSQMKAIVDKLLTQASNKYVPQGYVSEKLLANIPVVQSTGKFGSYGLDHLRIENTIIGGRGGFRRVDVAQRSTQNYSIEDHGLEDVVTKADYRNVEAPFEAEKDKVDGLTDLLWLAKEYSLASTVTNTSIITQNTTLVGNAQYSAFTTSNPLTDFATARAAIRSGCGVPPDTATMDWAVWNFLRYHPQILDSLGYKDNRPGGLSTDELANAMGVKRILIAEVSYNSAKEGQTDVLAPVWGKDIVFSVTPESATRRQTSLGYYLTYAGQGPRKVYKYPINNPPESMGILVEDSYDMFLTNVNAAYLIKNAVA